MAPGERESLVLMPTALKDSSYTGELFGYYHSETDIYNVIAWGDAKSVAPELQGKLLGRIELGNDDGQGKDRDLRGQHTQDGLVFQKGETTYRVEYYNLLQNIFSRNTGILETDWMLSKTVFLLGCGSVGSLVAIEMARAGVGNFVLVDNDIFSYHNICRHQCDIRDVGKYKVHALRERIVLVNPHANVSVYVGIVEGLPKEVFDTHCGPNTVFVGCADDREADRYAGQIASIYGIPFVSIGLWERAFAGEIYYYLPSDNMPCYECAIGTGMSEATRISANRRIYTTEEDLANVNFEPGISIDIDFVTLIGTKVVLDILNRDNPHFTPRLVPHLTPFTLVCNTNAPEVGGEMADIFAYPLQVTRSIQTTFRNECPPCKYRTIVADGSEENTDTASKIKP